MANAIHSCAVMVCPHRVQRDKQASHSRVIERRSPLWKLDGNSRTINLNEIRVHARAIEGVPVDVSKVYDDDKLPSNPPISGSRVIHADRFERDTLCARIRHVTGAKRLVEQLAKAISDYTRYGAVSEAARCS